MKAECKYLSEGELEEALKTPFYKVQVIYGGYTTNYEIPFGEVLGEYLEGKRADLALEYYSRVRDVIDFLEENFPQLENPLNREEGVSAGMEVLSFPVTEEGIIQDIIGVSLATTFVNHDPRVFILAPGQSRVLFPLSANDPAPLYLGRLFFNKRKELFCSLSLLVADPYEANRLVGGKKENIIRLPQFAS